MSQDTAIELEDTSYVQYTDGTVISLVCYEGRHARCPDESAEGGDGSQAGHGPLSDRGYYCECDGCEHGPAGNRDPDPPGALTQLTSSWRKRAAIMAQAREGSEPWVLAAELKACADAVDAITGEIAHALPENPAEHVITTLPGSVRDKDGRHVPNEFYEPLRSYPLTALCLICQNSICGECNGGPIFWRHITGAMP